MVFGGFQPIRCVLACFDPTFMPCFADVFQNCFADIRRFASITYCVSKIASSITSCVIVNVTILNFDYFFSHEIPFKYYINLICCRWRLATLPVSANLPSASVRCSASGISV